MNAVTSMTYCFLRTAWWLQYLKMTLSERQTLMSRWVYSDFRLQWPKIPSYPHKCENKSVFYHLLDSPPFHFQCIVCCKAKACMEVSPCGHQSQCRLCFVHTIQEAVAHRDLPLKCLVCRTKILRVKNSSRMNNPAQYDHPVHSDILRGVHCLPAAAAAGTATSRLPKSVSGYSLRAATQADKKMATSVSSYSISSGESIQCHC